MNTLILITIYVLNLSISLDAYKDNKQLTSLLFMFLCGLSVGFIVWVG